MQFGKKSIELKIGKGGEITTVYDDAIHAELVLRLPSMQIKEIRRASHVEWEVIAGSEPAVCRSGWTVRSADDPRLALRLEASQLPKCVLSREGALLMWENREDALRHEREHVWELIAAREAAWKGDTE
jgi:hypothetical protein